MDRTVIGVLTEHWWCSKRPDGGNRDGYCGGCGYQHPSRHWEERRAAHDAHQAERVMSFLTAAGLSRVLTDPEREALERLRAYVTPERRVSMPTRAPVRRADVAALVAVVERLAAAPAPEALADAVEHRMVALSGPGRWDCSCGAWSYGGPDDHARHATRLGPVAADAVLAVVGQPQLPPEAYEAAEAWMRDQVAVLEGGQAATHDTGADPAHAITVSQTPDGLWAWACADCRAWRGAYPTQTSATADGNDSAWHDAASRAAATDSGEGR